MSAVPFLSGNATSRDRQGGLPLYSQLPSHSDVTHDGAGRDRNQDEGDREDRDWEDEGAGELSGQDELHRITKGSHVPTRYPPMASAIENGGIASAGESTTAGSGTVTSIPENLCGYLVNGPFVFDGIQSILSPRGRTRLDTIEILSETFPYLLTRAPSSIKFLVSIKEPGDTSSSWIVVPDNSWEEVMVRGQPRTIKVSVAFSKKEIYTKANYDLDFQIRQVVIPCVSIVIGILAFWIVLFISIREENHKR